MSKTKTKRKSSISEKIEKNKIYDLEEAINAIKEVPRVKFDETVEIAVNLNAASFKGSQMIRGTSILPNGTGKKIRVLVICKGETASKAKDAGADYVGDADLIQKISSGWLDFDVVISTPDMMKDISKLGKILGPRKMMPSPKAGTVTQDVENAINEVKSGRVEFKMDKNSNINLGVGKISFSENAIKENILSLLKAIVAAKPSSAKGHFINSVALSTTMGPGIKINFNKII